MSPAGMALEAQLVARIAELSTLAHTLAFEKRLRQECLTRLRTGEAVAVVEARLLALEETR